MIFYFSGTGNSYYAANKIAQSQGEKLVSIAHEMDKKPSERMYKVDQNELIGFVYPIYAWGAPQIVLDFIRSIQFTDNKRYIFSLNTCGSEEGFATRVLQKALLKKGMVLSSAFSISMPSNYIIGEDVESASKQQEKLIIAEQRLEEINKVLTSKKEGVFELLHGSKPGLKTSLINPLFNKFARRTKSFYATDECIHCGLCEKICPVHTITLQAKPVWSKACTQCLGCINSCPVHAIQLGNATKNRGRYVHPNYKNSI